MCLIRSVKLQVGVLPQVGIKKDIDNMRDSENKIEKRRWVDIS